MIIQLPPWSSSQMPNKEIRRRTVVASVIGSPVTHPRRHTTHLDLTDVGR